MDPVSYWRRHCSPYLWARIGRSDEEEDGASLVEYALLVALIAVVCLAAITFIGRKASENFSMVGSTIN